MSPRQLSYGAGALGAALAVAALTYFELPPPDGVGPSGGSEIWLVYGLGPAAVGSVGALLVAIYGLLRQLRRYRTALAELQHSRRLLERTQRVGNLGSWSATLGPPMRIHWSAEVYRIFGVDSATWNGSLEDFLALVHPEDAPRLDQARRDAVAVDRPFSFDYRIRRPDGALRWVHTEAETVHAPGGEPVGLFGTVQDITERKLAEDALRLSEARFSDFAETASDWYWETGPDHRFTSMSGRLARFGQNAKARLGKRRIDLAVDCDEQPEKWRAHLALLDRHEPFRDFVYAMTVGDEGRAILSVSGKPFFDSTGRFLGYRGTARDVTATIEAEARLREAKAAAEAASAAKTAFLANMSHELRTPLNAIIGFAEALAGGYFGAMNDKQREYVGDIMESGNHLLLLISDLLDVAKIEAGKFELHREPVNIAEEVATCLKVVQAKAEAGGVTLAAEIAPGLAIYHADRRALRQVVLNLLSNAVKFTPAGGRVVVAARPDAGGGLLLSVTDTGVGIAPQDLSKIVVPFGALARNANLSRLHEGTGLGLPLSKSLIELHGGRLEIMSEVGRGTTATARFPAADMAA